MSKENRKMCKIIKGQGNKRYFSLTSLPSVNTDPSHSGLSDRLETRLPHRHGKVGQTLSNQNSYSRPQEQAS